MITCAYCNASYDSMKRLNPEVAAGHGVCIQDFRKKGEGEVDGIVPLCVRPAASVIPLKSGIQGF